MTGSWVCFGRRTISMCVAAIEWGLYLILSCFPFHHACYLDMVHSLFCLASCDISAWFSHLDFPTKTANPGR